MNIFQQAKKNYGILQKLYVGRGIAAAIEYQPAE
jgi:hypothetical protein